MFTIHVAWKFSEFLITHLKTMVKPLSIIGLVTGLNTEYWAQYIVVVVMDPVL